MLRLDDGYYPRPGDEDDFGDDPDRDDNFLRDLVITFLVIVVLLILMSPIMWMLHGWWTPWA